jgi:hypothetical protein
MAILIAAAVFVGLIAAFAVWMRGPVKDDPVIEEIRQKAKLRRSSPPRN